MIQHTGSTAELYDICNLLQRIINCEVKILNIILLFFIIKTALYSQNKSNYSILEYNKKHPVNNGGCDKLNR